MLTKSNHHTRKIIVILFLSILFLGFYFRIVRLDLFDYREDTKRERMVVMKLLKLEKPIYLGPQLSYGIDERCSGWVDKGCVHRGPLGFYILAIPYLISSDMKAVMIFYALLHVLTIALCYVFCCNFFNKKTAMLASAFFAISPTAIIMLRSETTIHNLIPLFTLLFFYSLFTMIVKKQQKHIILVFASLAYLLQFNPVTITLTVVMLLTFIFFRPHIKPYSYISGILTFILLFSPFLYHELTHNFEETNLLLKTVIQYLSGERKSYSRLEVFDSLAVHSGVLEGLAIKYTVVPTLLASMQKNTLMNMARTSIFIVNILAIASMFYIFYLFWRMFRDRKKVCIARYLVLLFWFFIPTGLYFILPFTSSLSYTYLNYLYPLQFILAAIFISILLESHVKFFKIAGITMVVFIVIFQIYFLVSFLTVSPLVFFET